MEENAFIQKIVRSDDNLTPLNLHQTEDEVMNVTATRREDRIERWRGKAIHGRFFNELNSIDVDKRMSCEWLKTGNLYAETEGFVVAIQDQGIPNQKLETIER